MAGGEIEQSEAGKNEWYGSFLPPGCFDLSFGPAYLTWHCFSLSDQQIGQLYELMQAIHNKGEGGSENE